MTSKGPRSSRRSQRRGTGRTTAVSASSGPRSTWTARNPSRSRRRRVRRRSRSWRVVTSSSRTRSARLRVRSRIRSGGVSRTIATHGRSWSRAMRRSSWRGCGCRLVASTTVSRPRRSRRSTMVWSRWKASSVADWSFSSSLTSARQWSELTTWVGRKRRAAKVDLPAPETPTSSTRPAAGMSRTRVTVLILSRRRGGTSDPCRGRLRHDVGGAVLHRVGLVVAVLFLRGAFGFDALAVVLHLAGELFVVPAERPGHQAGGLLGGGQAAVPGLDGDVGAPAQHVVEVAGALAADRMHDLGAQVVVGPGERPPQLRLLGDQVQHLVDEGAVAAQQVLD